MKNLKTATVEEIRQEQAIFLEAWNMIKVFYYIEWNDTEAWSAAVSRAEALYNAGKGDTSLLSKSITLAVMDYLEELSRNRNEEKIPNSNNIE